MFNEKKKKISNAALVPGKSIAQFVIEQLLDGIEVRVDANGKSFVGYVHNLDFGRGSDHAFASVVVEDGDDRFYVRVAINRDGSVVILKIQNDEDVEILPIQEE